MGAILHFGTDGWRARLDGDFDTENVVRVAVAAGAYWAEREPGAEVLVGYDTRPESEGFALAAAEAISALGLVAVLSDRPLPTPALAWATAQRGPAAGALMVTGSHHPMGYLGIKLRTRDGGCGLPEFYDEVEDLIEPEAPEGRGPVERRDLLTSYLENLGCLLDRPVLAAANLSVVVDPMYGAGRGCLTEVLEPLGVRVREIHAGEEPGWEDMCPEPIEPWVDECEAAVVQAGASAGLVIDGDGDRLGAVDERGRYVSAHQIIALILGHLVQNRGLGGRVVLGLSASAMPRRVARALGCRVATKPIGFKHIYREMLKGDVLLGGEGAGGIGIPSHLVERDGLLCCLMLCELMATGGKPLGVLVDELEDRFGPLHYARRDVRMEPEVTEMLRTILPGLNPPTVAGKVPTAVSHMDGLRLEFEDGSWLLIRPSGTEPLVRIYAEAQSVEERDELVEVGMEMARGSL